jgi:hypothetical protein
MDWRPVGEPRTSLDMGERALAAPVRRRLLLGLFAAPGLTPINVLGAESLKAGRKRIEQLI